MLKDKIGILYKELSFLYFQKSIGKLGKSHLFKNIKRLIAQKKTLLNKIKRKNVT